MKKNMIVGHYILMAFSFLALSVSISVSISTPVANAESPPPPSTPELVKQGKASYSTNCATCHGDKGDGKGMAAGGLTPPPRNFLAPQWLDKTDPKNLFDMITNGVPGGAMTAYKYLPEKERWALVYYIKSLAPKK